MAFILIPEHGDDIMVNAWNWRPTVEFLRVAAVVNDETAESLTTHGCGGEADADLAERMAVAVEHKLQTMKPGGRFRADLAVTDEPKTLAEFHKPDSIDAVDLYSATYEWLVEFVDFCRRSGGFSVS